MALNEMCSRGISPPRDYICILVTRSQDSGSFMGAMHCWNFNSPSEECGLSNHMDTVTIAIRLVFLTIMGIGTKLISWQRALER